MGMQAMMAEQSVHGKVYSIQQSTEITKAGLSFNSSCLLIITHVLILVSGLLICPLVQTLEQRS